MSYSEVDKYVFIGLVIVSIFLTLLGTIWPRVSEKKSTEKNQDELDSFSTNKPSWNSYYGLIYGATLLYFLLRILGVLGGN